MHKHSELQRSGLVVDVAEEKSEQECRDSLPRIHMQDGKEGCRHCNRYSRAALLKKASQHDASAEPFLKERSKHRH